MLCSDCDNGYACHICLMLVGADHCPASALRGCRNVLLGDLCEGDGGCGTSDVANNCIMLPQRGEIFADVYERVPCEPDALSELTFLFFFLIVATICGGTCRNWLIRHRLYTPPRSLASDDGAAPAIELDSVPCGVPIMVPVAEATDPAVATAGAPASWAVAAAPGPVATVVAVAIRPDPFPTVAASPAERSEGPPATAREQVVS